MSLQILVYITGVYGFYCKGGTGLQAQQADDEQENGDGDDCPKGDDEDAVDEVLPKELPVAFVVGIVWFHVCGIILFPYNGSIEN